MQDQNSVVNLGDLSKPANTLIEKISDAVGGVFKPYQIRRVAQAQAEAEKINAVAKIEINELQQRALQRFVIEETNKQNNMENIILKAIPSLENAAKPENIETDWISNFFDKTKLISDNEMQELWASILAGESNNPGSFSKRTINLVSSLDKKDALLFSKLSSFSWQIRVPTLLIYDEQAEIYTKMGINFTSLKHLDSIGLISLESLTGYKRMLLNKSEFFTYQDKSFRIEFPNESNNEVLIGKVLLTTAGNELLKICKPEKVEGFVEYVLENWNKQNICEYKSVSPEK